MTRTCIPDLRRHDRSDDPIPEPDLGLARLRESKTNIVIKGERTISTVCVPQGSGISRESVATVMNSTRWDRYFRKRGLRRTQVIQSVGY